MKHIFLTTLTIVISFNYALAGCGGSCFVIGGADIDRGNSITKTFDGRYVATGHTYSYGAGSADLLIVKFGEDGTIDWAKAVGGAGSDVGSAVIQTSDSGFAVLGKTTSYGSDKNFFFVKFDSAGCVEWAKSIHFENGDFGTSVIQTSDGGYLLLGVADNTPGFTEDIVLLKLGPSGAFQWARRYDVNGEDHGYAIFQTSDGGYAITGRSFPAYPLNRNFVLIKMNSSFSIEWAREIDGTVYPSDDYGKIGVQTADGGFVLTGYTNGYGAGDYDIFVAKFSSTGAYQWSRTIGGANRDQGVASIATPDGGVIITGRINGYGAGGDDLFLAKISQTGSFEWMRAVGGISDDWGRYLLHVGGDRYAVVGWTASFGAGNDDLFIVSFTDDGMACIGTPVSPPTSSPTPNIISPSIGVSSPSPSIMDVSPAVIDITPIIANCCEIFPPVAWAENDGPYCIGDEIHLFGGPDGMVSYEWSGPAGFLSTSQNPTIPAADTAARGIYTLVVIDSNGCSDTALTFVGVNRCLDPCDISVSAMGDTDICEGSTFEFYASVDPSGTSPPIYWSLDFGDGTVIQDSLLGPPWEIREEHEYSSTGTYTVRVVVSKPTNLGTDFIIDTSFPSPTADPGDLAWDGSHLWLAAHTSSYDTIYEITTAGVVVSKINSPTVLPYGLAYDGSHLWVSVTSWPPGIYEITTSGAIVSGPLSGHGSQESMGLGWQGTNRLWEVVAGASGHDSAYVTDVSSWSSPVGGFLLPRDWQEGCAYDDVHDLLWVCSWDAADPRIYGLNPATGAVEHSFPSPGSSPQGLAFDGICLWHSDKATDMIYRLCFPVDEPGCADTDYVNVTVRPNPAASASNDGPYCEGDTINLFGYPDGMASYSWTGPNGFSSSLQNPTIPGATTSASGTYTLVVTDAYGCTDTASTDVTVYPSPMASASSSDSIYCVGDTIYLYGGPDGMASYSWTGPNGFTSTLQNPIIPDADTLHSGVFILTVVDTNGCYDSESVFVSVELCCAPAVVWLECPTSFLQFSSCSSQVAIFGICDTTGYAIDTMRVYCTAIIRAGVVDTVYLSAASPYLDFSTSGDSVFVIVHRIWADGDTVEISLDSIYNEAGCLTIPH